MDLLAASLLLVFIVLYGVILAFFHKVEDSHCACGEDWRKTYMKVYVTAMIVYDVVLLVVALLGQQESNLYGALGGLVGVGMTVASLFFVIFGLQYVISLRNKKCDCAKGLGRDLLFWWSLVIVVALVLSLFTTGLHFMSDAEVRDDAVMVVRGAIKSAKKSIRK